MNNIFDTKDWIQILSTLSLGATAFIAPYAVEKWKRWSMSPKIVIDFELAQPYCHLTQMVGDNFSYPVYYFRFYVENKGKTQLEECEVILESIAKENSAGKMIEYKNFSPVNLKWSGLGFKQTKTIQPGRKIFCDIGRVQHPEHAYHSRYGNITKKEQKQNKFAFELPEIYFSQWDSLLPGKYIIKVGIYSKNAQKMSKEFHISWSGKWEDSYENMFTELVIS